MGGILPVVSSEQALREYFEASSRRDYPAAMSYYDEDVVLVSFAGWLEGEAHHGIDAVGKAFGDWMSTFAGGVVFEEVVVERGRDAYVVSAHMIARGRESGLELERDWAWAYWMRSGKIVRVEVHPSIEAARVVAGAESP
jgi:ketosteroid isomerase-like protein